jgi:exonuclease SbcC
MRGELAEIVELGKTKRAEAEHLTQRLAELSDIETQFAALEQQLQTLADPRTQAAALQQQIARAAALQKTLAENGTQTATLTAERAKLQAEAEQFATLDAQLAELNVLRQACEKDYHAYIANLKIAETLATQETELANLNAEIARIQTELQTVNDAVQKLTAQYDAAAHARAQIALEQARERVTQLATQLTHTREQFAQAQARLAQLEEVHQRRQTQLAAKTRAESLRTTADFIRDILQKAAPFITESYLFAISIEANQLYRELTGRHDVTLKWAKDYEITLEEEGRERPFANLSGGEQMAAALAVRLALLKELSEINLAFFDEPTTNMDAERRGNLAQQIGRIKDFQQLFVISHDDTFEGHTDQVILLGEQAA